MRTEADDQARARAFGMSDLRSSFDKGTNPPILNVDGYEELKEPCTECASGRAGLCYASDEHSVRNVQCMRASALCTMVWVAWVVHMTLVCRCGFRSHNLVDGGVHHVGHGDRRAIPCARHRWSF